VKRNPARYFFALLLVCICAFGRSQEKSPLVLLQTIPVQGIQGGFNHMSVDAVRQRLFAAASTNKTLEIIDLKEAKPWRSLAGERPAAARYAPEFDQLYVTRGQSVAIYDGKTYDLIATIDIGSNLDELQYDAHAKRLYVGCMSPDKTGVAEISIPDGKLLGMIVLPDKPQGIAVDHTGVKLFANMPDLRQVAVMDGERRVLLTTWQLDPGLANVLIGLDDANHRLFVGTRHPAQVLVLNANTGDLVATVDSNADADDLFYDAVRKRIYVSCGEGYIAVIGQTDADHYKLLTSIRTVEGARTSVFSEPLKRLYVAAPSRGEQPAEVRVFEARQ
jgi:DNA-binding beta-propeller fold protein YncE